jgi:hypothetical protein
VDLGKNPEKVAERVYDAAGPAFLDDGTVSDTVQREMIADASVRAKPRRPVLPGMSLISASRAKVSATLR